jgi:hypothetical protein
MCVPIRIRTAHLFVTEARRTVCLCAFKLTNLQVNKTSAKTTFESTPLEGVKMEKLGKNVSDKSR